MDPIVLGTNEPGWLERAVLVYRSEGVLAYPTETVYGLGGDPYSESAVRRVALLKGRSQGFPFLVLVPDEASAFALAAEVPDSAREAAGQFWPGPLTLVFRAGNESPQPVVHEGTIAVRVTPDPVCLNLLHVFRKPLVSTSANPSGRSAAATVEDIVRYFGGRVDLILDGGPRTKSSPSTVLDVHQDPPLLIREGAISRDELEAVLGRVL